VALPPVHKPALHLPVVVHGLDVPHELPSLIVFTWHLPVAATHATLAHSGDWSLPIAQVTIVSGLTLHL
jgi:hypothetical protein